jgi:hypothetical protein
VDANDGHNGLSGSNGAGGGGGNILILAPGAVTGAPTDHHSDAQGSSGGSPVVSVQPTPVCSPEISGAQINGVWIPGIQVNGQVTNFVDLNTTGYIAVYGTCLAGANSARVGTGQSAYL